jgi:8-oxo-dGTP diphosphatase
LGKETTMPEEHKKQANVGVSVLVMNGDRVLLEKRQHTHGAGTWGPPSGHIDFGEAPEETAVRETKEETGVSISDVKFRVITNDVFEAEQKHYITVWFDAKYVAGEAKALAPEEESEVGWFTWDSLPQPLFLPLQHLLEGKTYPSQTTMDKIGSAIETSGVLPQAEAL